MENKLELKTEEFGNTWDLTHFVNDNNIQVVAICHGEPSRDQDWVLFYYELL